ncbi:Oidioi.mRNA.OKI2018_I69.XSR.g15129.t1.cds [Oikopleura dioica]|uniref:Oidioi.mRNA.OKI2018_I69.XSR.g15129.t1.cds n=1 Tax=Oikopleura dioica TaxID=34765 RepID=A0ABN7SFZ7_OIKDI|nr:Oidioi.mRNA.OKI2018_I69.XSR.g15129.t1.cds [Oikopleura dioica]
MRILEQRFIIARGGKEGLGRRTVSILFWKKVGNEKKTKTRKNSLGKLPQREQSMTVLDHEHQGDLVTYSSAISDRFIVGDKVIARGKFGVVKRLEDRSTGKVFAGKFVKRGDVEREARLHSEVGVHPYIIGMEAFYRHRSEMVIVMELATRGDIFEYCVGKCPFTEDEAKEATRQVTSALERVCAIS